MQDLYHQPYLQGSGRCQQIPFAALRQESCSLLANGHESSDVAQAWLVGGCRRGIAAVGRMLRSDNMSTRIAWCT